MADWVNLNLCSPLGEILPGGGSHLMFCPINVTFENEVDKNDINDINAGVNHFIFPPPTAPKTEPFVE